MIYFLLIILYTSFFVAGFLKISRSYRNYISAQQVTISFITKVVFGMAYGFLFLKLYNGDDTWQYHNLSVIEYKQVLQHPLNFFSDIRIKADGDSSIGAMYDTQNSLWNKLDDILFVKMLVIFNILSFGNYYVNVVLFCGLVYFGHLMLFRQFTRSFPKSSFLLKISIFYFPMVIFWLSGIRKEGLLFLALTLVLYYFDCLLRKEKNLIKNVFFVMTGLIILLLMRSFMLLCLAPSLLAWYLCYRFKRQGIVIFAAVYLLSVGIFFLSGKIRGLPDLAVKVTQRQYDFLGLTARTRLPLDSLKGTASSYFDVLPQAVNHAFVRPYITESSGILHLLSSIDVLVFFTILIMSIIFRRPDWKAVLNHPLVLCCLFTAFFGYLIIGYTVPFPGAFVRYKAIFELLFLSSFLALFRTLNWSRKPYY